MEPISQFAHSLETSVELARRLENQLLEETRAIELRDPDQLQRVVVDKQLLADHLEQETIAQKQWVEANGHHFTPAGMELFFTAIDPELRLRERWSALRESVARCEQMNRTNAALINRDRKRVTLSLRILRGDDGSAATYDPHGRSETGATRSRTISRA